MNSRKSRFAVICSSIVVGLSCVFAGPLASPAAAADLTTWRGKGGETGYVVLADPTDASSVTSVHVLPTLCGPARRASADTRCKGAMIRAEGDRASVTWVLESSDATDALPLWLEQQLASEERRRVAAGMSRVPVRDLVRARDVTVRLRVDGDVVAEQKIDGSLAPLYSGTLKVKGERDAVDAVKRGEFTLEAEMQVPMGTYSGLTVKVDEQIVTESRVEAFRELVQSSQTSGGSFLFLDFKRTSRRRVEKSMLSHSSRETSSTSTAVLTIDADEALQKRLDEVLELVEKDRDEFVRDHRAAAIRAESEGRPALATAHVDYLKAVEANDTQQQDRILKMVAAYASGDIASFIAAGVAFSSGRGAARDKLHAVKTTRTEHDGSHRFSEVHIKTGLAKYSVAISGFPDVPGLLSQRLDERECFGAIHPNSDQATSCLLTAVGRGDLALAKRALQERPHVGARDQKGRTVLHHAAIQGDHDLVDLLLRHGASPAQEDVDGLNAADHAARAGHDQVAAQIERASQAAPEVPVTVVVELAQPGYLSQIEVDGRVFTREATLSVAPGRHALTLRVTALVVVKPPIANAAIQRGRQPKYQGPGGSTFEVRADIPVDLVVVSGKPQQKTMRLRFDVLTGVVSAV